MIFKNFVAADNVAVFINPDEFGEPKQINGEVYQVVVDQDLSSERPRLFTGGGTTNMTTDGVYLATVVFFVRESDLGYVPVEGEQMRFGAVGQRGYPYIVAKVSNAMGVLEVTLEGNET